MIEEKNDLMQNIGGDNNNLRKYLLLGGGVFVLFVIGIVVSKFIFSEPKKNDTAVILPPEVEKVQKKEDTALFNDIPVEDDFQKPKIQEEIKVQNLSQKEEKKEDKKEIVENELKVLPVEEEEIKPQVIQKKESKSNKDIKITEKPEETKDISNNKVIIYDYYIQVAAITRGEPSKKFLNLIKKNGFNYKIIEVNVKGMKVKRVLVGGFRSYKEAKNYLPKVRKNISSSAFIKRLK